ncbi:uncharacterized protein PV09_03923 [Verruconis gallopava]|uniref:Uncharacterized protein n=1 Tax=Verruconis gallopava TaxID=253628 RepID=A0A0D2AFY0_9PEZI|nr:uncharacterized protein PV09_03923 [Verruconis gallopava]KIW05410.1 hypothetical protein PV09_03923 [Verruconis gallopava]
MLATAWPSFGNTTARTSPSAHQYLPSRPSPLSPRNANACPRPQFWGVRMTAMSSDTRSNTSASSSENETPFSKRDVKPNPLLKKARQTPDEARERRRDMFMKKVERGREEKQWKGRSDQILRSDYIARRRRWEEERNREALRFFPDYEDEELPSASSVQQADAVPWPGTPRLVAQPDDEQQVDAIAQMEEEELRALLEMQEQHDADAQVHEYDIPSSPTRYGSDEEDYDEIFMELVSSQHDNEARVSAQAQRQHEDAEMMDML